MAKRPSSPREPLEKTIQAQELPPVPAPLALSQVLGQDRAVTVLQDALSSDRIHHAWIFEGPPGVGKFTTALSFAAMLLDPTLAPTLSGELEVDPQSRAQQLLRSGTHPDLAVITKQLGKFHEDAQVRARKQASLGVDIIRSFLLDVGGAAGSMTTGARASRVFIIDEAELLTIEAQNALLKYLEEPPGRAALILVCASPGALAPTIRSRCQRVAFTTLNARAMQAWADSHANDVPRGTRDWLLDFAEGSPGTFARARECGAFEWWARFEPLLKAARSGGYVPLGPALAETIDTFAKGMVDEGENVSKEAANRAGAEWVFRLFAWHARSLLSVGDESALEMIRAIHESERELDANVNVSFVCEKLAADLAMA